MPANTTYLNQEDRAWQANLLIAKYNNPGINTSDCACISSEISQLAEPKAALIAHNADVYIYNEIAGMKYTSQSLEWMTK